jgi:replicative DNA helicase
MKAAKIVLLGCVILAETITGEAQAESYVTSKIDFYTPPPPALYQFTTDVVKRYEEINTQRLAETEKKQHMAQSEKHSHDG